jgi:hypothetical protein
MDRNKSSAIIFKSQLLVTTKPFNQLNLKNDKS